MNDTYDASHITVLEGLQPSGAPCHVIGSTIRGDCTTGRSGG